MKNLIVAVALLCASASLAQSAPMPRDGSQASRLHAVAAHPSINDGLLACLRVPDGTKGRLDCFDAVIAPLLKTKPTARDVASCRYYTEQDGRLRCFNEFAESIPHYSSH